MVPSKAYGVLAAGRPLVYQGAASGEVAQMVGEEDVGWVVPPGSVESLESAILSAAEDREWLERTGRRAREVAEARYDGSQAIARYTELFEDLAEAL